MSTARMAAIAAVLFLVAGGCTGTLGQSPANSRPTDAQRRECERNSGSWSTTAGYCRVG